MSTSLTFPARLLTNAFYGHPGGGTGFYLQYILLDYHPDPPAGVIDPQNHLAYDGSRTGYESTDGTYYTYDEMAEESWALYAKNHQAVEQGDFNNIDINEVYALIGFNRSAMTTGLDFQTDDPPKKDEKEGEKTKEEAASGQGGSEINFNDNAWYVVPAGMNDLANTASGQAWTKSVNYVRIGSAEAKAQQLLSGVFRTTKYIGWAGNVVDLGVNGINAYNHWNSLDAGFYKAKAVGAGLIIGLNGVNLVVTGLGTVLSLTAGAIDAGGGFDWIYNEF